ncbi:hypothetical protein ACQPU1_15495 [Clostridium paraputrificum]|uniref:hypothetical protein n=1 Tax=Clostridium TaxID=1485 RepID=UPI003D3476D9
MLTQDTFNSLNIQGKNILRETQLKNISDSFVPNTQTTEVDNLVLNSNLESENIIK